MAFPDESLPLEFEAYLGDALGWVDLSSRLLREVKIRRGAGDGAAAVSAGSATVILDDDDGAVTPLNALGPYYPHVRRGVPARLAVRRAADSFGRTVATEWGTADSGQTWWSSAGTSVAPGEGRHSHSTDNLLVRTLLINNLLDVEQVSDITVPAAITGADAVAGHMARYDSVTGDYYWLYLQPLAGSSGVGLVLAKQVDLTYSEMATLLVPGVTYTAGQPLRLRSLVYGRYLAVKVWDPSGPEPRDWMLTATDTDITSPGEYGCQSWLLPGNSNTKPFVFSWSNYAARVGRLTGEIASYRASTIPRTDGTLVNATTIQVAGVLRRLGQGNPPADSPMRRTITAAGPLAYWPLEDEPDATEGASAIPGVANMVAAGTVDFGSGDVSTTAGGTIRYGTKALPSLLNGGGLYGTVPAGLSSPTAWAVAAFWQASTATDDDVVLMSWHTTGGTHTYWQLVQDRGGADGTYLEAYNSATATLTTVWSAATTFAGPAELVIAAEQNGANIDVDVKFGTFSASASVAGTLGRVTQVGLNPDLFTFSANERFTVGHVRVWDTADVDPVDTAGLFAHYGEAPGTRLLRLAAEDGLTAAVYGDSTDAMGSQPDGAPVDLYQDCATADGGLLVELRDVPGVGLRTRDSLYNQTPALVVDMSTYRTTGGTSGQVLAPVYDDQQLRTEVTASRPGGSSATVAASTAVADGTYRDQVEININSDAPLAHYASWLAHRGAVDETRHPGLPIDLAANPDLVDSWLAVDVGSRVQRTNVPAPYAGTIDQIVDGYTETLGPRRWLVSAVCSPASPWDVGVVEDEVLGRADTDGSELATDFDAGTDTSMSVAVTAGPLWITTAGQPSMFPVEITCGGVVLEVTGISGGGSPQTFTVTAAPVNGVTRTIPAGTAVSLAHPWRAAL